MILIVFDFKAIVIVVVFTKLKIVKRQISDPVQGGGDRHLDGHDPLLAAHPEGGALVECDPSPPDDYDDYQVDYRHDICPKF